MAESTNVVIRRFAQVTDMSLQTEGPVDVDA